MKPIKMFGLAALAALMAMAFVGASSAMAGQTTLCSNDSESSCTTVTHVHETTLAGAKAKLLSTLNVSCTVLFLGDTIANEGAPLEILGNFTYTECGLCTVKELTGTDSLIKVLRTSHETATVTGEGKVFVDCGGESLECEYKGEGLSGTGKGPLLSTETNGEVSIQGQKTKEIPGSGAFCPEESFLDIVTTPLSATYVRSLIMVCIDDLKKEGLYKSLGNGVECKEDDPTNKSLYKLAWIIR